MKVLLVQIDGSFPNLALMRLARHSLDRGDEIELRHGAAFECALWDQFDQVYASVTFEKSKPLVERLLRVYPNAIIGGTGWNLKLKLEHIGVEPGPLDYSLYPTFKQSIGFTQRGCRLKCKFCVVPGKEGSARAENTIAEIWRGDPWPRELLLLDNDFFGQPNWRALVREIQDGNFKVSFTQGINARFLDEEAAEAIGSMNYRNNRMDVRRIYTAWDNAKDEKRLFDGLNRLVKYGVKPDHIMVYMLIGYWPGETHESREIRRVKLREFGARPFPMAYEPTTELRGYQRWVIGAYDKRIAWKEWFTAEYRPEKLGAAPSRTQELFSILQEPA